MKQKLRHLIYFILLVVLDQITKYWARIKLQGDGPISIIPGVLKLQYHENTGAVWGIMTGKVEFLCVISIILSVVLVFIYFKIPQKKVSSDSDFMDFYYRSAPVILLTFI